ncbi:T-complex 11 [Coniochaeta ligniaria NRRL 30616]|uniref:T-complex 11 n=1 Tax=Coniochaeta ligniaria NRRL 30616 TaxID=1408157 RepID=A0A1J7IL09_9PEZI|nr:T-complex 11 [Coniochaeta ligniaria NRRL 30616]
MDDQRASGIESGRLPPAHARSSSQNESLGDTVVETGTVAQPAPTDDDLSNQPRQTMSTSRGSRSLPSTPPLSRASSTESRSLEPPVTKATLSELDVNKIIHNPKLRHDINFDPELHFRPNLDGERGRKKQEKANQFWKALLDQIFLFVTDRPAFLAQCPDERNWCLPQLLRAVREILQTLVPQRDREFLNEGLNVDLLMQQFNKGIADLEKLAAWLSGILKLHCAPMRDEWVDEMYNELSSGNRNNDMPELVKGMRTLLNVLEAMKLDVANHQIRCLRPVLIEDTVHFEQRFFLKKIQSGKLSLEAARLWYQNAKDIAPVEYLDPRHSYAQAFGETAVFFYAATKLILPSTPVEVPNANVCPNTFVFDEERILKLRSDMYDTICLEICMRQYEELDRMSDFGLSLNFNFNAPMSSRPSSLVGSDNGSQTSSPRTSGYLCGQPMADPADASSRSRELYNSLLALLQTAPPVSRSPQRWQGLSPSMALQILRYVNAPQIPLSEVEDALSSKLSQIDGEAFQDVEAYFHRRLLQELSKRVKDLRNLSGVGLFEVATGGRVQGLGRTAGAFPAREQHLDVPSAGREPRDEGGIDDMATRLAHLGLLHWRVWADIAYEDHEVEMATCAA